ncbi:hypothetical protein BDF20DRAFT_893730 [Mycotypha africana]|uniref:uncharacterized protein n=1 Tax=Mycotypha africana TaxID=64632 RepID=UPI0022FFD133|nr:uncharacterized protein BDF20DRAFT_893730 [Mycotypha africana]KAI8969208.1 hypothetical protein BDF20DRAFT_893730 [Mycotypha africana]
MNSSNGRRTTGSNAPAIAISVPTTVILNKTQNAQQHYYNTFQLSTPNSTLSSAFLPSKSPTTKKKYSHGERIDSNGSKPNGNSSMLPATSMHTNNEDKMMVCSNCEATSTPLWRRSADDKILCNACGLYYKLHKIPRPKNMKKDTNSQNNSPDQTERMEMDEEHTAEQRQQLKGLNSASPLSVSPTAARPYHRRSKQFERKELLQNADAQQQSQQSQSQSPPQIICSNCKTTKTPLWRRDVQGAPLCNACGLYLKLHNEMRPLSMKTDVIKKRQRTESLITSAVSHDNLKKPRYYDQKSLFSARNSDGTITPAYKNAVTSLPGTGILMMTTNMNSNKTSSSTSSTTTTFST